MSTYVGKSIQFYAIQISDEICLELNYNSWFELLDKMIQKLNEFRTKPIH